MENLEGKFANVDHFSFSDLWQKAGDIGAAIISQPLNVVGIDLGQRKLFSSDEEYAKWTLSQKIVASAGAAGTPLSQIIAKTTPVTSSIPTTIPIATNDTLIVDNHNMILIVAGVILLIILITS